MAKNALDSSLGEERRVFGRSIRATIYCPKISRFGISYRTFPRESGRYPNMVAGLIAYTHQSKKPSLNLRDEPLALLPATLI